MIGSHQHRKMWNTWNAVEWFLTFSKCHEIPRQEPTLIHFLFLPLKCKTASRKMNLLTANKSYNIKPARPFLHLQKEIRAHGMTNIERYCHGVQPHIKKQKERYKSKHAPRQGSPQVLSWSNWASAFPYFRTLYRDSALDNIELFNALSWEIDKSNDVFVTI